MANWWDSLQAAPAQTGGNWWDSLHRAPEPQAGPPPSKLGSFGFDRPGVPEAFKKSYRNRELMQGATKKVLGGAAESYGNLATLPGRVIQGKANLNDPQTTDQAIALGMMISPGPVVGRGRVPMSAKVRKSPQEVPQESANVRQSPQIAASEARTPFTGAAEAPSPQVTAGDRPGPSLTSAIRHEGKLYRADPGGTHLDALSKIGKDHREAATLDGNSRVFATENGRVLDRARAQDYAVKHDLFAPNAPAWARTAPELTDEMLARPGARPSEDSIQKVTPEAPARQAPTPKSFWTYQAGTSTPTVKDLPEGSFKGTQEDFEKLSPGMRREILRSQKKPVEPEPGALGAAATGKTPTAATIEEGKGIWGRPTAGREVIQQQIGESEQVTARTRLAFEEHRRLSNEMSPQESIDTIRYMQHRSAGGPLGTVPINPKFQEVADAIRRGYVQREAELKSLDEFTRMNFEEDHFTQKWEDPRKAKDVWDGWRSKEGSKGFSKAKKYLDFDAGLAAGLKPKSLNIVDVAMNDFANIDRVVALAKVREIAEDQGYLKWVDSKHGAPSDWVQLKGYGADRFAVRAYAPASFARNYNNFVGRGILDTGWGGTYQGLRAVTNGMTQLELGFSAFHASTIGREAIATGIADAAYELSHGRPLGSLKSVGKASVGPVYYAARGKTAGEIYLGLTPGSSTDARAVQALVQVNAHMGKLEPALLSGKTRSLVTQISRGAVKKDMANSLRRIKDAEGFFRTIGTGTQEAAGAVGEVLNTVSEPLFQHYIPAVKRGVMLDHVATWIDAHPTASWDEILAQARDISNIVDERMGEMRQDNLFWEPVTKQAAQVAMRSTGWAYGSWTQYFGGVKELGSIGSKGVGRRTSYLFADAFTTALIGGIATYIGTGKPPSEWRDYIWGKTGGTTTVHAGARTYKVDERVNLPGSIKEIVGVTAAIMDVPTQGMKGFTDYARNKENSFVRTMGELMTGEDWRGAPLVNPWSKEPVMKQWFRVASDAFLPIAVKQEEPDKGSKLNFPGAAFLGFRPTGRRWIDPKGFQQGVDARLRREAKQSDSYKRRRETERTTRVRNEDSAIR